MKSKVFMILFISLVLMFGAISIASASGTFVFATSGDATSLDPGDVTDNESMERMDNIFECLVGFKPGTTEIQPWLATSWDISSDGKEIVFHLRKGVKFHDGTDFNADAVVFSFARQYDTNHPYYEYGEWALWKALLGAIEKAVKIDDYTVKIVLRRKNAATITSLTMMYAVAIVSPANAEKYKEDAFKHPCGTGPFKFVEWAKDDHITLEANENYWGGKPKLDKLIFKVIPDPSARLMALEVGEAQGIEYPNPADFERIKANKDLVLMSAAGMNIGYMAINTGYGYKDANENGVRDPDEPWVKTPGYLEPLTKKKVRQAINMAIDKQSIVDNIYMGTAVKAKNGMPPFMLGYNDAVEDYPYDPEKAKVLLAEAGYPDGFDVTLYVMPVSRAYMFDPPKIGEAIQSYLAAVGIKVEFYQADWGTYLQEVEAGKHQMCLLGITGDTGDTDDFMSYCYAPNSAAIGTASNQAFYNNEEVQKLISKSLQTYDKAERAEYYKKVQEIIHEDAPWVYLAHANQSLVFSASVHDFVLYPTSRMFFYPVWIE
ncbi:MAG TPA: ABC transporter substrate-binding protein [Atribacterota bacterium]|nr:ABC transporter substrate-binding protein [Atribacterota bacterium]